MNKGEVIFTGNPPFAIKRGLFTDKECTSDQCSLKLAPGFYHFELSKEKHIPVQVDVQINRWETVEKKVEFSLEPQIKEVGNSGQIVYPAGTKRIEIGQDIPLASFQKNKFDLSAYPKPIQKLSFSRNANSAVLFDGKESALFDLLTNSVIFSRKIEQIDLTAGLKPDSILYLSSKTAATDQILYQITGESEEQIVTFPREIKTARVFVNPENKTVTVLDLTERDNKIYIVDVEKKSKFLALTTNKKSIATAYLDSSTTFIYVEYENTSRQVYSIKNNQFIDLPVIQNAAWLGTELMLIAYPEQISADDTDDLFTSKSLGASIKRPSASTSTLALFSYDPKINTYTKILALPQEIIQVSRLETDSKQHAVYLSNISGKIWKASF